MPEFGFRGLSGYVRRPSDKAYRIAPTSNVSYSNIAAITDGDATTYGGATSATVPQYVQVDLGAAFTISSSAVVFHDSSHTSSTGSLQYSTDGTTWISLFTWSADTTVSRTWVPAAPGVAARYWRLNTTNQNNGFGVDITTWTLNGT